MVSALSVLLRGTLYEKLQWTFSLYDINGDGIITKDEMMDIVSSIYDMMGHCVTPAMDKSTVERHVDRVFEVGVVRQCLIYMIVYLISLYFDALLY